MNKRKIILLCLMFVELQLFAARIDTLYYDNNWKGVESPQFASFMRIAYYPSDPNMPKKCKDYYITGELQGESNFISIDKYDDSKSVFDGDVKFYYKNGQLEEKLHYVNGKLDGELVEYYPNGKYKTTAKVVNGYFDGYHYDYSEDNRLVFAKIYKNGVAEPYYHKIYDKKDVGVFNCSDNQPIITKPTQALIQKEKIGDTDAYTYLLNGIRLTANMKAVKDYGKYYRVYLLLTNYTNSAFNFDVSDIEAKVLDKNLKEKSPKIYNADEYIKKIGKKTALAKWYHNTNERINAAQAGQTTIQTQVNGSSQNTSNTYGNASAYSSNGSTAYGNFTSQENSKNSFSGTASTVITDYSAAYEAQQAAQKNIDDYNSNLEAIKKNRFDDYIHNTTLQPYTSLIGYINIDQDSGNELDVVIHVNNQEYSFSFPIGD